MISYKDAGVDREKGDLFVDRIKKMVGSTYNENVVSGVGGFASLYKVDHDRYMVAGTDGVGTKLLLAQQLGVHHTIGQDLVAMCVNDVICTGARPLFFLDYLATGKLDVDMSEKILQGIIEGCLQSRMALVGGETAEMPGLYNGSEYDLAGFAVGEVYQNQLLDGKNIQVGDSIMGLASSGFHSNGYSLIRKVVKENELDLLHELLTPTRIYVQLIQELQRKIPKSLKAFAHITGSGFENIPRVNENFNYRIDKIPSEAELPKSMVEVMKRTGLPTSELLSTFNCGIGFVIITDQKEELKKTLSELGEKVWELGVVVAGHGDLELNLN